MMTREEWAKRPLAERVRAYHIVMGSTEKLLDFALDLPDTPATRAREIAEAVKPWRDEVKGLADLIDEHAPMGVGYEVRKAYIEHARALLAAAQGASHE